MRRSTRTLLAVLALTTPLSATANTNTIATEETNIVEVTVFPDRAEVTREVDLELPAGTSIVEFHDIPAAVELESLRVAAEGTHATLGSVGIDERVAPPVLNDELIDRTTAEINRLGFELQRHAAQRGVDRELREYLEAVRAKSTFTETGVHHEPVEPATVTTLYGIMREELRALADAELDRDIEETRLKHEMAAARTRLAELRSVGEVRSRVATVEVDSEGGPLKLRLAYITPGASWRPAYRATLIPENGHVDLVTEAIVTQHTGESWDAVHLRLSTASPASGIEPPVLDTHALSPFDFAAQNAQILERVSVHGSRARAFANTQAGIGLMLEFDDEDARTARVQPAAVVSRSAYVVSFQVPGRPDIPADRKEHRVTLSHDRLAGELLWRTVPQLADHAYLTAIAKSPSDYPLLAGPVRMYSGGTYLGSFRIDETAPGSKLTLPFGIDNRIGVMRVPVEREADPSGKNHRVDYAYKTRLKNLQDRPVTLLLEDRVPVASDERIVVQVAEKQTTPGFKDSELRPGVKLWTLELAPGEERDIVLAYSVRYPNDLAISGLE